MVVVSHLCTLWKSCSTVQEQRLKSRSWLSFGDEVIVGMTLATWTSWNFLTFNGWYLASNDDGKRKGLWMQKHDEHFSDTQKMWHSQAKTHTHTHWHTYTYLSICLCRVYVFGPCFEEQEYSSSARPWGWFSNHYWISIQWLPRIVNINKY